MSIKSVSLHSFHADIEWLFELVAEHVATIGWAMSTHKLEMPRIPKRLGEHVLPYALAANLRMLYDFAKGSREISHDFVKDTCDALAKVLFSSAADAAQKKRAELDWGLLQERPLGITVRAALARVKLQENRALNRDELWALTGLSESRAERMKLKTHPTEDGQLEYDAASVLAVLNRSGKDDV